VLFRSRRNASFATLMKIIVSKRRPGGPIRP
jgi:hypothetical protein